MNMAMPEKLAEELGIIPKRIKPVYNPAKYNAWVDAQLSPSDRGDAARALARRVKMHEFVMTGGLVVSTDKGITTYGDPVDPATTPECPWHGEGCSAWREIVEGRGYGSFDGPTLRELREMTYPEVKERQRTEEIEDDVAAGLSADRAAARAEAEEREARLNRRSEAQRRQRAADEERWRATQESKALAAAALADMAASTDLGDEIVIDGDEDDE